MGMDMLEGHRVKLLCDTLGNFVHFTASAIGNFIEEAMNLRKHILIP